MLLAIDVGNTNAVIGLFEQTELRFRWRIASDSTRTSDEYAILVRELCAQSGVSVGDIGAVVLASVVPALTGAVSTMSEVAFGIEPVIVGPDLDMGIAIDYDDPREVGPDRLANAVAARHMAEGAAIVVDFGTATTVDVVTSDGRYLGGAIAPGILTSAENLFRKAALLHRVALDPPSRAIGRSTEEALRAGIVFGAAGQVDEIVRRVKEELGEEARVIATGGLADRIALFSKTIEVVEPDLTLLGLSLVFERVKDR
ncbi:MAG: type III pantothenate kinase [Candidatus Eisenbacteria bacterium]